MNTEILKKIAPYFFVIVFFALITIIYFNPLLEGKRLRQSDINNWKGMSKEIVDYRNETGEEALWTNSMFGGMPAYMISVNHKGNLISYVHKILKAWMPSRAGLMMLSFVGFFLLLVTFGMNPWLGLIGSLAFTFSSYFFIIIEVGHVTKAQTIAYMAPVLMGIILTYRGKYLIGGLLSALFISMQIWSNHLQVTYYLLIALAIYLIILFIYAIREKTLNRFIKASLVVAGAAIFAVIINISHLWPSYEYSKYTIRSKSELTFNVVNQTSGLDKDYATAWSYGIPETLTVLVPNVYGGASNGELDKNSHSYQVLRKNNIPNARRIINQMPLYWGKQPFTSGPVYFGAIVMLLFIAGLFLVKGPLKWWLGIATIVSIILSWGNNIMWFTSLLLDYFPLYNKFRAVSSALIIAQFTVPLLAILSLKEFLDKKVIVKEKLKALKWSFVVTGGISLLLLMIPTLLFDFTGPKDQLIGFPDWLMDAVRLDRIQLLKIDAFRSLIFITISAALLFLFVKQKLKVQLIYALIPLLILIDMWPIAKRYLNNDDFVRKSVVETPFEVRKADKKILEDKTLYFRVCNFQETFDNSPRTSYFHKNIGGYHGAKFRRYQELIDYHFSRQKEDFVTLLSNNPTNMAINLGLRQMTIFNMMNTRYFIYNLDADPLINYNALGNAWFVNQLEVVETADREITALNDFNPAITAVLNKDFENKVRTFKSTIDTSDYIELIEYKPNKLVYEYSASGDMLTVFSEIFYDKGWKAYVDGKEIPHFRVNYVLRGCVIPAGINKVEFVFKPQSFILGEKISFVSSLILFLLLFAVFGRYVYIGCKKKDDQRLKEN